MNIEELSTTKPHNPHFLRRYLKFIEQCRVSAKGDYIEMHHILPKANDLFPEHKKSKQNIIALSPREHFICHMMLWKAYGGSQAYAFWAMVNGQISNTQPDRYVSSRTYESLKIEAKKFLSENAGRTTKGKTYEEIYGEARAKELKRLRSEKLSKVRKQQVKEGKPNPIPKGSKRPKEIGLAVSAARKATVGLYQWVTNGVHQQRVKKTEPIPKGYRLGRK